ncbi:MAG TPA: chemotaxis protein CheB [Caulobacteraceae bacterium]|nr:chemotaxis protein CheB [Caulobacteraceae bacterium]
MLKSAGSPGLVIPKRGGTARAAATVPPKPGLPLIVGIGASAGGFEAFKSFLGAMPSDSGMAFVLVQHLSPDHTSMLAELLGRVTSMSVTEATDGAPVEANRVFVIPPNSTLTIAGGRLAVCRPAPPHNRRPIDTFFQSLAEDQGEKAIGVVLAGTGSDGSLGLAAIKESGGLTLAQAESDHRAMAGMPSSAAETGQVDDVLPVEAMPARLMDYKAHLASVAIRKGADGARKDAGSHLATIIRALRARTGHDFSGYKEKTVVRRLQRRMQVLRVDTPGAYIEHYRRRPEELDLLFHELLIGVTEFFRDPAAFEALAANVLKGLVAGKDADQEVRIWVPGCATGEEAFSIAILVREAMAARRARPKVQIFGTDIDERAVAVARLGRYRKPAAGLSAERIERWFTDDGDYCCVIPDIREMCVFSTHSIIKHPPFSKLDLISCRNLLIYLDTDMQDRVMRTFHYALKPGGRLFLGSSESVTRAMRLFVAQDKKHRIFERRDVDRAPLPDLSTARGSETVAAAKAAPAHPFDRIEAHTRQVTEKYNPPHVVIDSKDQVVRFSGPAIGKYVALSAGAPSYGLFDILRRTLRQPARAAVKEARASSGAVRHENIPIRIGGRPRLVTLIAEPLADHGVEAGFTVLIFREAGVGAAGGQTPHPAPEAIDAVKALEQELRTTRAQLQSTIDELETANEELKSSNEEQQSINEEFQSSNEELETAKEEMQSVNEEVQTINAELAAKNEQLTRLNSDLRNFFDSTEIATLFLDADLRVKKFTPGIRELFHVREADIGRPITEIVSLVEYRDLQHDARTVLRKLTMLERQVSLEGGGMTFILRLRPYRTVDNVIDGVVATFIDITGRQAASEALRASEAKFRMLFDFIDEGFCTLEKVDTEPGQPSDFRYLSANPGFEVQSGVSDVVGKTIRQMFPGEAQEWFDIYDDVLATGKSVRFERELLTQGRTLEAFAFRFQDGAGPKLGVIFLDVSQRSLHEQQQKLLLREMDHRVKNLFAIVGGMVTLTARSAATPRDLAETVQGRLDALASAHRLVMPQQGHKTPHATLEELVRAILAPYIEPARADGHPRVEIDGPEVSVGNDTATGLALVIHELATNAAKYGALSVSGGHVGVSWSTANGRLCLSWQEAGGPLVNGAPSHEGFGARLARRSVKGQLGGDMVVHWNPDGLAVVISAPMERLAA